jgi:hypothetical protein
MAVHDGYTRVRTAKMLVKAVLDEVKFHLVTYLISNVYGVRTNRKPNDSFTKNNTLIDIEEILLLVKLGHFNLTCILFKSADVRGGLIKGAYSLGRLSNDRKFEPL